MPPGSETASAGIPVQEGQSIEAVCRDAGLPVDLIALYLVNGRQESGDYVLRSGDDVKLVALIGGGEWPGGDLSNHAWGGWDDDVGRNRQDSPSRAE